MQTPLIVVLGLAVGVLTGLMGVGGGIILVPAFVYLLGMDQHTAQGTSLLILLPPLGLGALALYWRRRRMDLPAGILCAAGFLLGGFFGGRFAVSISSRTLQGSFGVFVMCAAVLLWRRRPSDSAAEKPHG